jgi:hypothetical protein
MRRWRLDRRIRIEAFYLRRTSRPASHAGSHLPNHRPWMGGDAARSLTAMAATPAAISIRRRSLAVAGRAVAAGQTIRRGRAVGNALPVGRRGDRVRAGRVRGGALVGGVWRPEGIGDDGQQRRWIDAVRGCPSGEAPTVVVGEAGQVCRASTWTWWPSGRVRSGRWCQACCGTGLDGSSSAAPRPMSPITAREAIARA